jgi:hypothetical protein
MKSFCPAELAFATGTESNNRRRYHVSVNFFAPHLALQYALYNDLVSFASKHDIPLSPDGGFYLEGLLLTEEQVEELKKIRGVSVQTSGNRRPNDCVSESLDYCLLV